MAVKSKIKGKKKHQNKPTSKKSAMYKIEGGKIVRAPYCPRCGPASFLMKADNRMYCGKCHYTEFTAKKK
jgi:small subunit ribosomal protein S27Ae